MRKSMRVNKDNLAESSMSKMVSTVNKLSDIDSNFYKVEKMLSVVFSQGRIDRFLSALDSLDDAEYTAIFVRLMNLYEKEIKERCNVLQAQEQILINIEKLAREREKMELKKTNRGGKRLQDIIALSTEYKEL